MEKKSIKKLYYSIGEVADMLEVKPYVLRYWETEFPQLKPTKNRAGNRSYRDSDIEILFTIKDLLYTQKYTIEGARQQLDKSPEEGSCEESADDKQVRQSLEKLKHELREILELLDEN